MPDDNDDEENDQQRESVREHLALTSAEWRGNALITC